MLCVCVCMCVKQSTGDGVVNAELHLLEKLLGRISPQPPGG